MLQPNACRNALQNALSLSKPSDAAISHTGRRVPHTSAHARWQRRRAAYSLGVSPNTCRYTLIRWQGE